MISGSFAPFFALCTLLVCSEARIFGFGNVVESNFRNPEILAPVQSGTFGADFTVSSEDTKLASRFARNAYNNGAANVTASQRVGPFSWFMSLDRSNRLTGGFACDPFLRIGLDPSSDFEPCVSAQLPLFNDSVIFSSSVDVSRKSAPKAATLSASFRVNPHLTVAGASTVSLDRHPTGTDSSVAVRFADNSFGEATLTVRTPGPLRVIGQWIQKRTDGLMFPGKFGRDSPRSNATPGLEKPSQSSNNPSWRDRALHSARWTAAAAGWGDHKSSHFNGDDCSWTAQIVKRFNLGPKQPAYRAHIDSQSSLASVVAAASLSGGGEDAKFSEPKLWAAAAGFEWAKENGAKESPFYADEMRTSVRMKVSGPWSSLCGLFSADASVPKGPIVAGVEGTASVFKTAMKVSLDCDVTKGGISDILSSRRLGFHLTFHQNMDGIPDGPQFPAEPILQQDCSSSVSEPSRSSFSDVQSNNPLGSPRKVRSLKELADRKVIQVRDKLGQSLRPAKMFVRNQLSRLVDRLDA